MREEILREMKLLKEQLCGHLHPPCNKCYECECVDFTKDNINALFSVANSAQKRNDNHKERKGDG